MSTALKVLIVEDDLLDAELAVAQLEDDGFSCDWKRVQTAQALRKALQADQYDLLLIDYNMPGFDGLTALHIVKEFNLDVPAIFVTGNLQPELAIDSINAGALDFVHKDRLARLGSSVRRALEEFELRRQNRLRKAELRLFRKLNDAANQGESLQNLVRLFKAMLPDVFDFDYLEVFLYVPEKDILLLHGMAELPKTYRQIEKILGFPLPNFQIPLENGHHYATCLKENKLIIHQGEAEIEDVYRFYLDLAKLPDALKERAHKHWSTIIKFLGIKRVLTFPLIAGDVSLGVLEFSYKDASENTADIERIQNILGQISAIFARRRLEEEFIRLNEQQAMILNSAAEGIIGMDMEGRHIFVNPAASAMLGYAVAELQGKNNHTLYHRPHIANGNFDVHDCVFYTSTFDSNVSAQREYETVFRRKDGTDFPVTFTSSKIIENGQDVGVVVAFRDMTEQLESTRTLARLGQVVEQVQASVGITDLDANLIYVNPFFEKVSGYSKDELLGQNPRILKSGYQDEMFYKTMWDTIVAGKNWHGKFVNRKKNGEIYYEDSIIFPVKTERDEVINYATVKREITAEVKAQHEVERQFARLEILHRIDAAILASTDLSLTLDVLLSEAMRELDVDAIDLLLFNPDTQSFSCISRLGFRTNALEHTNLRMGEGLAGQAALTRKMLSVTDLREIQENAPQLIKEGFLSYYGVPLIARGEVKGVLEIFQRSEFTPDDGWINFLTAIARQAAIAIESAQLLEGLHNKNRELQLAYEATLEGWVRGLEIHDLETEGHSRRVVDMTLRLARRMGYPEDEMEDLRRGALLHDIGKLGVPTSILNKKGPLTAEERALIEQHTNYAHTMLSDIPYLRPALDIPYSHHERWDGTGYPQGLKGTDIPLSARIFAVIDVYDALIFDRPYRKAWDREEVLEHLRKGAGTHFDPQVVDAFFDEFVFEKEIV